MLLLISGGFFSKRLWKDSNELDLNTLSSVFDILEKLGVTFSSRSSSILNNNKII